MEFSKNKILQIIDSIKECYFEVDLKGTITNFNESLCKVTGYSREELLGLNYKYITDEANRKKVFKGFNTVYTTGEPLTDFQYEFRNKNGTRIIGETSVYLKYDSKGNKIGFYGLFRDITKKKEEEIRFREELEQLVNLRTLELRESKEKYHQLFNKAPYPIGLFDFEGNLLDCNSATNNLLSIHTLEDYIGKNYRDFWSYLEKDKPLIALFNNKFTEIIKTGKTLNFEFPIYRTSGGIIWCYATASKIKIGKKEFIQIILMDISAQKETQQRLKESEEKYRNLVENAQEGVWAVDENDDTIFVNPKMCNMLGYTKDEMLGKSLQLFLEDSMIELINSYRKRREKGLKDTYELEFIKKDGTLLSTSINASPILNENGEFKGSFAYINDITNRKIAEQKLKESEEKYSNLFHHSNDGIFLHDLEGNIIDVNQRVLEQFGYTRSEILKLKVADLHPISEVEASKKAFEEISKKGVIRFEISYKKKNGKIFLAEVSSSLFDMGGNKVIQGNVRDITVRVLTEKMLKESEEKYRNMINHLDLGFYQLNWDGMLLNHNPRFCEILGYSPSENLKNRDVHDFWQKPEQRRIYLKELEEKGFIKNYLVHAKKKDGEKIVVQLNSHIIKRRKDKPVLIQGLISDITEKFELEQKLKQSEEKYRILIEDIQDGVFLIQDEKMLFVNEAFAKMVGYTVEEIIGMKFQQLIVPEDLKMVAERYQRRQMGEGAPKEYEFRMLHKDGKTYVNINMSVGIITYKGKVASLGTVKDITEQKKVEQRLKESEEMYRLLAENINDIIVVIDDKLQVEYINEEVHKKVLATTKKDILGKNILDFVHPDDKAIGLNSLIKGIKDEEGIMEIRVRHRKGHYIWFEVKGRAFLNNKGELKGILIARDITERKHAEEKLRENEERYRTLVETMTDGLAVIDENNCFTYLNMSFSKMIGYPYDELLGISVFNYLDKKNQSIVEDQLNKRREGEAQPYELMWTRKDGQKVYTIMAPKLLVDAEGNYIGSFAVITNITERIIAEQKLKESEERYRNLIESVPFSIALIDQQGILIYCNPAIEKLLGYKREELIGYEFKNLPALHPKYIPIMLKRFKKVLNGEILPPLEIELYKKDGSSIWIRYQSTLLKLGDNVLLQTVINDITEHKKADLLIEEEILKLKELDQIRKDLISRVSHELKTPLVSVCGAAELLLDLYIEEFKDEPKELIEMIEKGGNRLKYLVDNLVDITRIEYKKFELEKDTNDINQLIRDCLKEMMYLIKKRDLNLELDLTDELFLEIDKIRIEQVILNLLSNAIKNTPPNGKILVNSLRKDNHVEISIKDTGIGLTKEEMDKLFTRFGKIERYGIGLYISKEIIDLHEGNIRAESEGRNKGSTFIVKLPI